MSSFKPPDYTNLSFEQLAKDDAEFGEVYKANKNWMDFQNPQILKYEFICQTTRKYLEQGILTDV